MVEVNADWPSDPRGHICALSLPKVPATWPLSFQSAPCCEPHRMGLQSLPSGRDAVPCCSCGFQSERCTAWSVPSTPCSASPVGPAGWITADLRTGEPAARGLTGATCTALPLGCCSRHRRQECGRRRSRWPGLSSGGPGPGPCLKLACRRAGLKDAGLRLARAQLSSVSGASLLSLFTVRSVIVFSCVFGLKDPGSLQHAVMLCVHDLKSVA